MKEKINQLNEEIQGIRNLAKRNKPLHGRDTNSIFNPYPTFLDFIKNKWWLLLLVFAKIFDRGSWIDILILIAIILFIMFIYWFIRYGKH